MNQPVAETTWPRILPFYRVLALVLAAASTFGLQRRSCWRQATEN